MIPSGPYRSLYKPPIAPCRSMHHIEETKGENLVSKRWQKRAEGDRKFGAHLSFDLALWEYDRRSRGVRDGFQIRRIRLLTRSI